MQFHKANNSDQWENTNHEGTRQNQSNHDEVLSPATSSETFWFDIYVATESKLAKFCASATRLQLVTIKKSTMETTQTSLSKASRSDFPRHPILHRMFHASMHKGRATFKPCIDTSFITHAQTPWPQLGGGSSTLKWGKCYELSDSQRSFLHILFLF